MRKGRCDTNVFVCDNFVNEYMFLLYFLALKQKIFFSTFLQMVDVSSAIQEFP